MRRSESMGRAESERRRVQRSGTLIPPYRQPGHMQTQEYHNYSQIHHKQPHMQPVKPARQIPVAINNGTMTLTNNRTGSHLVNGKLYSAKAGFIINSHGQVVNLSDGEVLSLVQAERLGIVHRQADKDHTSGQSYVPASNMMFNRVSIHLQFMYLHLLNVLTSVECIIVDYLCSLLCVFIEQNILQQFHMLKSRWCNG